MRYTLWVNDQSVTKGSKIFDTDYASTSYIKNIKCSMTLNSIGSLTFTIYPNHPRYDSCRISRSDVNIIPHIVTLIRDEGSYKEKVVFKGRIIKTIEGMYRQLDVTCEEYNGFLMDSRIRPAEFGFQTVKNCIYTAFQKHTARISYKEDGVNSHPKWNFGIFTFDADGSDDSSVVPNFNETEYATTWDFLHDKIISPYGGYFLFDYSTGATMKYKRNITEQSSQNIVFGKNMIDFKRTFDISSLGTSLIPLGALNENGYMTITSVNPSGTDYIESDLSILKKYGKIERIKHWDGQTTAGSLYSVGVADKNRNYIHDKVEATAVDMSYADSSIRAFELGKLVRVISEPHLYDDYLLIKKISIDVQNPVNNKIVVGGVE